MKQMSRSLKRFAIVVAAYAVILTGTLAATPPANAQGSVPTTPAISYTVKQTAYIPNYIDYSNVLLTCSNHAGGTCGFSQTVTVGITITVSLGYSRAGVAVSLGISKSTSVSLSVNCSRTMETNGQIYRALPQGQFYEYNIYEWQTGYWGAKTLKAASYNLVAFYPRGIACI